MKLLSAVDQSVKINYDGTVSVVVLKANVLKRVKSSGNSFVYKIVLKHLTINNILIYIFVVRLTFLTS